MYWSIFKIRIQGEEWTVSKDGSTQFIVPSRAKAEEQARELAKENRPAIVLFYMFDGTLEYAQQYND